MNCTWLNEAMVVFFIGAQISQPMLFEWARQLGESRHIALTMLTQTKSLKKIELGTFNHQADCPLSYQ